MATATATSVNSRQGSVGRLRFVAEVALTSGVATVNTSLSYVDSIQVTEKGDGSAASGDTYSGLLNPATGAVVVYSSNGSSTETVYVEVVGY